MTPEDPRRTFPDDHNRIPARLTITESNRTTDHETIKNWVEERDGRPARVEGAENGGEGVLRVDFTDDESLEPISWDDFFDAFEENDLALVYQEETDEGEESRFAKLVSRE